MSERAPDTISLSSASAGDPQRPRRSPKDQLDLLRGLRGQVERQLTDRAASETLAPTEVMDQGRIHDRMILDTLAATMKQLARIQEEHLAREVDSAQRPALPNPDVLHAERLLASLRARQLWYIDPATGTLVVAALAIASVCLVVLISIYGAHIWLIWPHLAAEPVH